MHENWEPVRNAKVEVHSQSTGTLLGQNYTDDNGNFNVTWNVPAGQSLPKVELWFLPIQREGRFKVNTTGGTTPINVAGPYTLIRGQPIYPASIGIGTSGSANQFWNAYWAAERLWRESYAYSGHLAAYYTNVEIRGFANTINNFIPGQNTCSSSCADGPTKRVLLDANAAFSPQARVMHEMGHVADYVLHNYKGVNDYCWPSTGSGCGWSQSTAEWGAPGFEEAIATLGGNATFWWPDATTPTTCNSAGSCYDAMGLPVANTNIEATSYPYATDNCVANEGRRPISHMRFHWDVYDAHNDADGDTIQDGLDCFWCVFANLIGYGDGTDANQINEPWNSTLSSIDNFDGRGSASWDWNYRAHIRTFDWLRVDNCSPP